jgi:hypothetical protein
MPGFSNSAATQRACKSRSPIRTASLLLTRARGCEISAEIGSPNAVLAREGMEIPI